VTASTPGCGFRQTELATPTCEENPMMGILNGELSVTA
jgi:hypothetical protein